MTDARLKGEWLGKLKFDGMSDTAWRVFTCGLMWCAEQGTDGYIPSRYLKTLHPDGEKPHAVQEIAQCGLWEISATGVQFIEWEKKLGQSTALQVETYKANGRERQRRFRERERAKLAKSIGFTDAAADAVTDSSDTSDVTRYVTGDVGRGEGTGEGLGLKESATNPEADWVVDEATGEVSLRGVA
jgi:hypothetical protein